MYCVFLCNFVCSRACCLNALAIKWRKSSSWRARVCFENLSIKPLNSVCCLCSSYPLLLPFSFQALTVYFLQEILRECHFLRDKTSPEMSFRGLMSSRKLSGENGVIFRGPKFTSVLRNTKECFRELYGSLFGPEQFSGVLRNARLEWGTVMAAVNQ